MKYKIIPSKRFEKDMKRCQKRGYDQELILVMLNTGALRPVQQEIQEVTR